MSISKNLYEKIVWATYVIYLFSIVAFGDRAEYYMVSNLIFLILVVCMFGRILISKSFKLPIHILIFLPFTIYSFMSMFWSYLFNATLIRTITVFKVLILMIVMSWYLEKTGEVLNYIYGLAVAGVLVSIYVVKTYGISELRNMMEDNSRVGGEIVNENTLAIFLALSVIVLFFSFLQNKNLLLLIIVISLIALSAMTGSKKGLIDLAVGILGVLIFSVLNSKGDKNRLIKWTIWIIIIALAIYFAWQLPIFDVVRSRFELMFSFLGGGTSTIDYSTKEREKMIEEGIKQFFKTPIVGIGIGATAYITNLFMGRETYLHNNYVELLASGGIIGTLLYYIPIISLIIKNYKNIKESIASQLSIIILVIILINDFAAVEYFSKISYILFSIAISAIYSNKNNK